MTKIPNNLMMCDSVIACRVMEYLKILIVILMVIQELDGQAADSEIQNKSFTSDRSELERISDLFDSFVINKLDKIDEKDSESQNENEVIAVFQTIKTRLHQQLSERMKLDQNSKEGSEEEYDFTSLAPYFNNNTKLFDWITENLLEERYSNFKDCNSKTKSDFRAWVDKNLNTFTKTSNGMIYFPCSFKGILY